MNRIQFIVLIVLSALVVLLIFGHIALVKAVGAEQLAFAQAQAQVNQGQAFEGNLKQLAVRIFQDSQTTQDPGLSDILKRNQISYKANTAPTNSTSSPTAPAPTH